MARQKPSIIYENTVQGTFIRRINRFTAEVLIEVKGCTLASVSDPGVGLFPDASTERGVKHLHELTKAAKEGCHCSIAFVIQMNGIHRVLPNVETQPEFKTALVNAAKSGVQVVCYGCHVEADSIKLINVIEDTVRFAGI